MPRDLSPNDRLEALRRSFEEAVLDPLFSAWLREARAAGIVPADLDLPVAEWRWEGDNAA
jgi:capsid protein